MKILLGAPNWHLSGANTLNLHLVRSFNRRGWDARILLTAPRAQEETLVPDDVPCERLPTENHHEWPERWDILQRYLKEQAPCVWFPNYDFINLAIVPALPPEVRVLATAHSDEGIYYRHLGRMAPWLDGLVAVSEHIGSHFKSSRQFEGRVRVIHPGVEIQNPFDRVQNTEGPLRILYTGRLTRYQKRVMDLVKIAVQLRQLGVPFRLDLVGSGEDEAALKQAVDTQRLSDVVHFHGRKRPDELTAYYRNCDVFLLVSDFEGLSVSLLEAMAAGAVPVVSDVRSGISECVAEGDNGFVCPIGGIRAFADAIQILHQDREQLIDLGQRARQTVEQNFSLDRMAEGYANMIEAICSSGGSHGWKRPVGPLLPPPELSLTHQFISRVRNRLNTAVQPLIRGSGHV